eukprot:5615603-Amphidinium_carterae.1
MSLGSYLNVDLTVSDSHCAAELRGTALKHRPCGANEVQAGLDADIPLCVAFVSLPVLVCFGSP